MFSPSYAKQAAICGLAVGVALIAAFVFSEKYVIDFKFSVQERSSLVTYPGTTVSGYDSVVVESYQSVPNNPRCMTGTEAVEFLGDKMWSVDYGWVQDESLHASVTEIPVDGKKLFGHAPCIRIPYSVPKRIHVVGGKIVQAE